MKNEVTFSVIIAVAFIIFGILYYRHWENENNTLFLALSEEYPACQFEDSLYGEVQKKYYPEKWRGQKFLQYVTFTNGMKRCFSIKENINSEDIYFDSVLKKGSLLIKKPNSDTLQVVTFGHNHFFILRKAE
ncbi:MAG: hypothetical protein Q8O72_10950 [Bacteroidales bacterium]|nr:hypothetical protein [Bacteroidales bacterium]